MPYHEFKKIQGTGTPLFNYLADFRIGSQEECVLCHQDPVGVQVFSKELLYSNWCYLETLCGNSYLTC